MSTRFLVEKAKGQFEDVGADFVEFTPTHIAFYSYGATEHITRKLEYAIRADLVRTIVEDS